jgi:hypothetical protein
MKWRTLQRAAANFSSPEGRALLAVASGWWLLAGGCAGCGWEKLAVAGSWWLVVVPAAYAFPAAFPSK